MANASTAIVGIIMGGKSDWETMQFSSHILSEFGISHETRIISAHRTPEIMFDYAKSAEARGLHVIIAGAGGAAHLPGMVASLTLLPVIGVPVESRVLRGVDSLLSIVQMPTGVPVATMSIGPAGAKNAGIMAAQIIALSDSNLRQKLLNYRRETAARIEQEKLT